MRTWGFIMAGVKPRIDSIRYSYGPAPRKKPQAGDERFLKGRGVWQVRQQVGHWTWRYGDDGPVRRLAMVVSNGRPVWEWVDKGSDRDRERDSPKRKREEQKALDNKPISE